MSISEIWSVVGTGQLTTIVAFLSGFVSLASCKIRGHGFEISNFIGAVLNGATIVPFAALGFSSFSEGAQKVAEQSTGSIAIAGLVGLLYVCHEVIMPSHARGKRFNVAGQNSNL